MGGVQGKFFWRIRFELWAGAQKVEKKFLRFLGARPKFRTLLKKVAPSYIPELLAKKLGENIKKPKRSTQNRFKICQKSQTEISAI